MYQEHHLTADRPMQEQFDALADAGVAVGPSPGGAAGILGITRQSVYEAINRGALRAYKVYYPNSKDALIFIDPASLDAYQELRVLNGGRIPYRARAI